MEVHTQKLGLGTVQWGLNYGISNNSGITTPFEVKKIIEKARSVKINLLDTSPSYGNSEKILGSNNLKSFNLITKTKKFNKSTLSRLDGENLILTLEKSLKNLSTNSIYGILIHNSDDLLKPGAENIISALKLIKKNNLVEKIGISVYNSNQIKKVLNLFKPDIVQLPINIFDKRLIKDGTLNKLKELKIETHARSIFLQGLFFIDLNSLPSYFLPWKNKISEFHKECKSKKITPLKAALSFVLETPEIDKCIIGVNNLAQLEEILESSKDPILLSKDFDSYNERLINPSYWN